MSKLTKTAALFLAAVSVYSGQAFLAKTATAVDANTQANAQANGTVHFDASATPVVAEIHDPFGSTTQPSATPATQPTESAASEGTSVNSNDVAVTETGAVEIHVNDANLVEVLRMLSLQSQKNIVASKEVGGKVTANLYGVTVREALDAILKANGYAYREKGNFIYVYTSKEIADIEKSERKMVTEVFHLYYSPAANVQTMIKPVLSGEAQVSYNTAALSGIETGSKDAGGNSVASEDAIVVTDYQENLDKVRKLIKDVDKRPQQILIEATILRASLSEDNALGIDFNVVGGVDFTSLLSQSGQIINANINNGTISSNNLPASSVGTGNTFSSSVPNGFKVGFVSNNVSVFLSALESVTDTTVLANPKVLALNKQRGEVIVGRKDGYLTTNVTETTSTQTVEFLDTGTRLVFRPFIGDDDYVRMEIHPEDSTGGLNGSNLPFKVTTEVTSNIMVKDGRTILIGGLFRDSSTSARNQVPVLGNLPWVGALFRQQRDQTTREEIIILLTPHIIKDDAVYSEASVMEQRDMEKLRVGVRRGMMPWGRERLAEAEYEHAVREMAKPNPNRKKALWYLDSATNLNPKFVEAIALREQITGKEVTSVDNSSVRYFLRNEMMMEKPLPTSQPSSIMIGQASEEEVDPTTQPTKLALGPATQPSTQPALVSEPTTAPAVAETPTTLPAVAELPTTQPGKDDESTTAKTDPEELPGDDE